MNTIGQDNASELITGRIRQLGDWRGEKLAQLRQLIHEADPAIVEEWKWGVPVWSHDGIICTGESYKQAVKLTFAKGAHLKDPKKLFNSSLDGNLRRAIDFGIEAEIDGPAFKALIQEAVAFNRATPPKGKTVAKKAVAAPAKKAPAAKKAVPAKKKAAGA